MKLLSTEQQNDLRELLEKVGSNNIETEAELQFWRIELKPKRIRKKKEESVETGVDNTQST